MGICVSCRRRERKAPEKRTVPGAGGPAKGAAAAELLPRRADRLPMMANSMTNIKIKNPLKIIVSRHRKRYMKDGFNLDLAYITDKLIAMGFPAEKLEGVYRNHIDEVYRFLEKMHKDHYKIYNLCTERSYDSSKFHERVKRYAFDDHTPPSMEMIQPFCEDVHNWLSEDPKNVAAVHCKAGKGRTGTMICCYLLYSRQKATADEALKFYGTERTYDDKGVTIPSQRRYVEYYAWLLNSGVQYTPTKVHIRELIITPPPFQYAGNTMPELQITQLSPFFQAPMGCHEVRRTDTSLHVRLTHCTPLCGDVRVNLNNKQKMKRKLLHFWFNTFFVACGVGAVTHPPLPDSPNLETFKLTLNKTQLDDAHKDDKHKYFSQDFKVELIVQKLPDSCTLSHRADGSRAPSPPSSTASSCSEPDTEPDSHWDSGERISYQPLHDDTHLLCHTPPVHDDSCDKNCSANCGAICAANCGACGANCGTNCTNCGKNCDRECANFIGDCKIALCNVGTANSCGDCNTFNVDGGKGTFTAHCDTGNAESDVGGCKGVFAHCNTGDAFDCNVCGKGADDCNNADGGKHPANGKSKVRAKGDSKTNAIGDSKSAGLDGSLKGNPVSKNVASKHIEEYKSNADCKSAVDGYINANKTSIDYGASDGLHKAKNGSDKVSQCSRKPLDTDFDDVNPKKLNTGSDYVSDAILARKSRNPDTPTINPLYCSKTDSNNKKVPEFKATFNPPDYFDQNEPMETSDTFSSAPTSARESPVEESKKRSDDKTKPRLSLGDMRASWREFSRRRKDES